jgi:hypothetical protein
MTLVLLTSDERKVIEMAYFHPVAFAWEVTGWSKGHYYRIRNNALEKIAISLNLM